MKKTIYFVIIFFLITLLVIPASAGMKKLGQTGMQFLEIGISARAAGMGDAFVLAGDDANAMFYNPAGLASMQNSYDVVASRVNWIADIAYNGFGLALNPSNGKYGKFGISVISASYGDFLGTRVDDSDKGFIDTGTFSPGAFAIGLTYSRQFTDRFMIGAQVKFVSQKLGSSIIDVGGSEIENEVSGLSFDFGTIYHTGIKSLDFGMYIRNFSQDFKYELYGFQAPLVFRVGFSMNVMDLFSPDQSMHKLLVAIDAVHPRDYTERIDMGAEYWLMDKFALRGGYKFNYDEQGVAAGLGIVQNIGGINLKIDYAFSAFGIWDSVQRVSMGIGF